MEEAAFELNAEGVGEGGEVNGHSDKHGSNFSGAQTGDGRRDGVER